MKKVNVYDAFDKVLTINEQLMEVAEQVKAI
jgi:hypothetical protein